MDLTQGNGVQADRVGTVNINGAASTSIPHELPLAASGFAGRGDELARLDELLADHARGGSSTILITGPAGVGKSELALHWAHRNRAAFPDGELCPDLDGSTADALAGALRGLGDQQNAAAPTLRERAKHYRSKLNGRKVLILLDGVHDVERATDLFPGDRTALVLLTSRDELAGLPREPTRIALSALPGATAPVGEPRTGPPETDPVARTGPAHDVFVSYAAEDAVWAMDFVERLRAHGIRVTHDVVLPGDRIAETVERAIADSRHGVLVFSRATMNDDWIREEYAVLLGRSIGAGPRFIPVVIDDVRLPGFAAARSPSDFRCTSGSAYDRELNRLVRAVKSGRTSG